jgi:hypothetical protein
MIVTAVGEHSQAGIIHMLITGQAKKKPNRTGASRRISDDATDGAFVDGITGATNAQFVCAAYRVWKRVCRPRLPFAEPHVVYGNASVVCACLLLKHVQFIQFLSA